MPQPPSAATITSKTSWSACDRRRRRQGLDTESVGVGKTHLATLDETAASDFYELTTCRPAPRERHHHHFQLDPRMDGSAS
jgi:hypothetical protein